MPAPKRSRGTNASQSWDCEKCGHETIHTVKTGTSKGGRGVFRTHVCSKCGNKLQTIERRATTFHNARRELQQATQAIRLHIKSLEAIKASADDALSKLQAALDSFERVEVYREPPSAHIPKPVKVGKPAPIYK